MSNNSASSPVRQIGEFLRLPTAAVRRADSFSSHHRAYSRYAGNLLMEPAAVDDARETLVLYYTSSYALFVRGATHGKTVSSLRFLRASSNKLFLRRAYRIGRGLERAILGLDRFLVHPPSHCHTALCARAQPQGHRDFFFTTGPRERQNFLKEKE